MAFNDDELYAEVKAAVDLSEAVAQALASLPVTTLNEILENIQDELPDASCSIPRSDPEYPAVLRQFETWKAKIAYYAETNDS